MQLEEKKQQEMFEAGKGWSETPNVLQEAVDGVTTSTGHQEFSRSDSQVTQDVSHREFSSADGGTVIEEDVTTTTITRSADGPACA